ncbi:MAG TPA: YceI family protein [Phycisphaerae bacterium]|nr:YceI family protein [Phycisphaerae bacterium]
MSQGTFQPEIGHSRFCVDCTSDNHRCPQRPRKPRFASFGLSLPCLLIALLLPACSDPPAQPQGAQVEVSKPLVVDFNAQKTPLHFVISPDSYVELNGTATIGSWYSRSTQVQGQVILAVSGSKLESWFNHLPQAPNQDDAAGNNAAKSVAIAAADFPATSTLHDPPSGALSLPVVSLRSDNAARDHDLHDALNAQRNPAIDYIFEQLKRAQIQWDANGRPELDLLVLGKLTLAGVQRSLLTNMFVQRDVYGHFYVWSKFDVLMSDYGIIPPSAFFGLIKADNRVSVIFDLDFTCPDTSVKTQ